MSAGQGSICGNFEEDIADSEDRWCKLHCVALEGRAGWDTHEPSLGILCNLLFHCGLHQLLNVEVFVFLESLYMTKHMKYMITRAFFLKIVKVQLL